MSEAPKSWDDVNETAHLNEASMEVTHTEFMRWQNRLAAVEAERDALKEAVRQAEALLRQVPRRINDSFSAGMEERENGSFRRQGELLDKTRAFEAETKSWLAKHGGGDG